MFRLDILSGWRGVQPVIEGSGSSVDPPSGAPSVPNPKKSGAKDSEKPPVDQPYLERCMFLKGE